MLYYILRPIGKNQEPVALFRINAKCDQSGFTDITGFDANRMVIGIGGLYPSRFGLYVKIERRQKHIYNLFVGDNPAVVACLNDPRMHEIEKVSQAEWETFEAFELFPILKVGMAL